MLALVSISPVPEELSTTGLLVPDAVRVTVPSAPLMPPPPEKSTPPLAVIAPLADNVVNAPVAGVVPPIAPGEGNDVTFAVPLNELPPIVRVFCNAVAVAALPLMVVWSPVLVPEDVPEKLLADIAPVAVTPRVVVSDVNAPVLGEPVPIGVPFMP
jgi:hypothetical protein